MDHKTNYIFLMIIFLILGCGPGGVSQFERKIVGNYTFHEMGSFNKYIEFSSEGVTRRVIDMTVVQYVNNDRYIVVLRQPSIVHWEDKAPVIETIKKCEYWIIDSQSDDVSGPFLEDELKEKNKEMNISINELKTPISSYISNHMNYCL